MRWRFANIDLWAQGRLARAGVGESNDAAARPARPGQAGRRNSRPSPHSGVCPETFKQWWETRRGRFAPRDGRMRPSATCSRGNPVLLWADTFNNHFLPATAKAAVEVLEAAGFDVTVPRAHLCCGRPLYDVGMLDRAKSLLLEIMDELLPEIEAAHAHRRSRTELRRRLPRRTHEPFPQGRTRASPLEASLPAQRISGAARQGFSASQTGAPGAHPRAIAITRPS